MNFRAFRTDEEMFEAEERALKAASQGVKTWQMDLAKAGAYA